MSHRINFATKSPDIMKKFVAFFVASKQNAVEESIRDLVNVRIAQLNACTFSLDMYVKQAKRDGERELRLYHLASWRGVTLFSPRERASLAGPKSSRRCLISKFRTNSTTRVYPVEREARTSRLRWPQMLGRVSMPASKLFLAHRMRCSDSTRWD
ncbi:carboxymuconolactone decarboxylase family protein [Sinorhizobium medicae]